MAPPCINAWTASGITLAATDLDGEERISGAAVDMGADEFARFMDMSWLFLLLEE